MTSALKVFKYHFPFEYWTLLGDINGGPGSYIKADDRVGMLIPGGSSVLYLVADEQMEIGMQVRNLKDRSGKDILVVGATPYPMYVTGAEPQLDINSNLVGWRHTLKRQAPDSFLQALDAILNG